MRVNLATVWLNGWLFFLVMAKVKREMGIAFAQQSNWSRVSLMHSHDADQSWHCCRPEFWQRLCLTSRDQDTSEANFCFTILSSLRMGSYWNPEIPLTCSWDDPSPQSSSTSPSLEKKIRSLGFYFFRNSASRKPNSEIILQTFFFLKIFPKSLGFGKTAKVWSLDRKIQRRSCGWKRLWA